MPDGTSRFSIDGKVVYHFMGCSTFAGKREREGERECVCVCERERVCASGSGCVGEGG